MVEIEPMNHSLAEDATCVRCGKPYPWPQAHCTAAAKVGNRIERSRSRVTPCGTGFSKGYSEAYVREVETRSALQTLPMTLSERIGLVLDGE